MPAVHGHDGVHQVALETLHGDCSSVENDDFGFSIGTIEVHDQVEDVTHRLEFVSQSLAVLVGEIPFVQEILKAKKCGDKSATGQETANSLLQLRLVG